MKKRVSRILLDIDDVCNRFTMYTLKHAGCPVDYTSNEQFPSKFGFDIVGAANELLKAPVYTARTFWERIPRSLWASVPESAEFHWLLSRCEQLVGRENVCFLTSPTLDPDCLAGKLEWIHEHAPSWMHRQFLVGPVKQFCAHPEALLIDDADKNVNKFRAWGGQAILVPRPWNSLNPHDTLPFLESEFNSLETQCATS
jgi:hypothetical protein